MNQIVPENPPSESYPGDDKSKNNRRIIFLVIFILVFLLFFAVNPGNIVEPIRKLLIKSGPWGYIVSILVLGILGITPIPSEPITVLLTGIYGPLAAMCITWTGNLISALVEYAVGMTMGGLADFDEKRKQLPMHIGDLPVDSPVFLIAGRMVPAVGPKLISLVGGIYRIPIRRYIWTTLVANSMGAFVIAFGTDRILRAVSAIFH